MSQPSGVLKLVAPRRVTAPAGVPKSSGTMKARATTRAASAEIGMSGTRDLHFLAELADTAHRHAEDDAEERLPAAAGAAHVVREEIAAVALELDVECFVFLERGIDEKAEGAAGLEHGAVPGMLRQQRAAGLLARAEADAGPGGVGKELNFQMRPTAWVSPTAAS